MKLKINWIAVILLINLLMACDNQKPKASTHKLWVFGTVVEINIWADDIQNIQSAINEISNTFNAMHHQWHAWKPGRLTEINHSLRSGKTVHLTKEELSFIQQTIDFSRKSQYLFNPAIGELIHLWGFHADEYPILTPPPSNQEIQTLATQNITVENLIIDGHNLSSNHANIWLDFGGIAKGYAIDMAVDILNKHQISNAIINAGGDLRSIGSKGDMNNKAPWRIAIQSPIDTSMLAEITINGDESIFTSGNYQRYKEFNGQRYAHIIHPETGWPVNNIISATVIAADGITADAAATALVVAGTQWTKIVKSMHIEQALIINEQLQCFGTRAMINRLENQQIACHTVD